MSDVPVGESGQTPATPDGQLLLRAICDPGSFLPRGDYDGEPYGESIQHWEMRAVQQVINEWLAGRTVLELPQPDGTSYEGDPIWSAHVDYEETIFACVEDGQAMVESPFSGPMSSDTTEMFGLRLLAAAYTARRLASESSGDGENRG